jgi:rhodanese-related sulfurtransferase
MNLLQNLFGGKQSADLKTAIEQGAFLVDVREPGEFAGGSAKGAVNIPLGNVAAELDKFKGKENIIVFCRSGNRSGQAKSILEQNGFKNVINGGAWEEVNQFTK